MQCSSHCNIFYDFLNLSQFATPRQVPGKPWSNREQKLIREVKIVITFFVWPRLIRTENDAISSASGTLLML